MHSSPPPPFSPSQRHLFTPKVLGTLLLARKDQGLLKADLGEQMKWGKEWGESTFPRSKKMCTAQMKMEVSHGYVFMSSTVCGPTPQAESCCARQ